MDCGNIIADNMSYKGDCLMTVYTACPWGARDFRTGEEILVYFSWWVCYNMNSNAAPRERIAAHGTNKYCRQDGRSCFICICPRTVKRTGGNGTDERTIDKENRRRRHDPDGDEGWSGRVSFRLCCCARICMVNKEKEFLWQKN